MIYIGADHRGFELKEKVAGWLFEEGHQFIDVGAFFYDRNDDYTKYAEEVGSVVGKSEGARGILICGSGVGVDVLANKFDGVRASIGKNEKQVAAGRNDDNMNILVLASDYTSDEEAESMLAAFLGTKFEGKARHKRRLREIEKIEANN
ncbi:MAG TPA: RpiB/LacA/LacB family sugar-phosphate isomerase [Patescibacteria group bacterium]|nr:RpiB/LacA/LacB family sugar-phosphate isomerase [Patescibacteria group bacterium]